MKVYFHHDAERLIKAAARDFVNIKFSKSGGILEAIKINNVCKQNDIPCMIGGMPESRIALTAFAHFAMAHENIIFHDIDTCMVGHKIDPVKNGIVFNGFTRNVSDSPGIGADADDEFINQLEKIVI